MHGFNLNVKSENVLTIVFFFALFVSFFSVSKLSLNPSYLVGSLLVLFFFS